MIRIASEANLLEAFRDIDRGHVDVPSSMKFPLLLKYALNWVEPSGHRAYLVFEDAERPQGIVFERSSGGEKSSAAMCQWCHCVRVAGAVALMTATADRRRRIGLYLCADLGCLTRIDERPGVHDFPEFLDRTERRRRLIQRMHDFAYGNLF